jgi:mannose/cellobiose epimerase-like protein (N-acyl-D-glucosamine 2-epimerase family)
MSMNTNNVALDLAWFKSHLLDEILPKWQASITDQGLFLSHFDRKWQPLHRNYGTLVSQCRLLYNFSQGYALTGNIIYRDAVEKGVQFLLDHFRDWQHGGWYWSCGLDREVLERRKDGYGHAFVIFGLAHAYQCTSNPALQEAMYHTWEVLSHHFRDEYSGYHWRMSEDFVPSEQTKSQNPTMHLFEALLAASSVVGAEQLLEEARGVGDFVLHKLVRTADRRLPEVYDQDWIELAYDETGKMSQTKGGRLDIGHAFEWAYLTSYAQERGLPTYYGDFANSFMLYGLALGLDWEAGGIYSPTTPGGQLTNQRKGWWEQCEAIRALLNFVVVHNRKDLMEPLQKMIQFMQGSMIDREYGGWYPNVGPGIAHQELEKGNEWKLDYHVVGMCMEAVRLSKRS